LQIAHSVREGKKVRQQVIAILGRLDLLQPSGRLERLMRSGVRHCEGLAVSHYESIELERALLLRAVSLHDRPFFIISSETSNVVSTDGHRPDWRTALFRKSSLCLEDYLVQVRTSFLATAFTVLAETNKNAVAKRRNRQLSGYKQNWYGLSSSS